MCEQRVLYAEVILEVIWHCH